MILLSIFVFIATARHTALAATCDELGWTNAERFGDPKVCGESNKNLGGCSGELTWADANMFCETAGARLCTLDELLNDEPRGTGCLYNWVQVWSSTACTLEGSPGFWRAFGNSREGSETVCTQDTSISDVRCCADVSSITTLEDDSVTEEPSLLDPFPVVDLSEDVPGTPFVVVPDCDMSESNKCTLDFGPVRYSNPVTIPPLAFTTRGFQQTNVLQGPVIRVRAGDTFQIQFNNGLSDDDNTPHGEEINIQHLPNTTNIHTVRIHCIHF